MKFYQVLLNCAVTLVVTGTAEAGNGFVGVYADSQGTVPCSSVPQYSGTLLYLLAKTEGASTSGITGAEFRVEVSNPDDWSVTYIPPSGAITLGVVIDTNPSSNIDGSGLDLAFPSCHVPGQGGTIALGSIYVYNAGGNPTVLQVKRHTNPSNASFQCPAFVLCDAPYYSMICMSPSTAEPCSLGAGKAVLVSSSTDPAIFTLGLNAELDGPAVPPEGRVKKPIEVGGGPTLVMTLVTPDVVNALGEVEQPVEKVLSDTTGIADWNFDGGGACQASGWTHYDNRDLNSGEVYWTTENRDYLVGIDGHAAVLKSFRSCWADTGYGNDWDQSLRLNYQGLQATLSFDFVLDTYFEDGMTIEADINCASQDSVNREFRPSQLRIPVPDASWWRGGAFYAERVSFSLPPADNPNSCVYIRFTSDRDYSDEDGLGPLHSQIGAGLIIDNIQMTGGIAYTENFESPTWNANVVPVNSAPSIAYGDWARTYLHVTDNDHTCLDNFTCSWLFTDPLRTGFFGDMRFGPGEAVIRDYIDDVVVSPWIDLQSIPPGRTYLTFREFPGNRFSQSRIMRSYSVRGKTGSCVSPWSNDSDEDHGTWQDLGTFLWTTRKHDMSIFVAPEWDSLQVRFRVADWRYVFGSGIGNPNCDNCPNPGPGPYIDRVRIGRQIATGPSISVGEDSRSQAQDDFAAALYGTSRFRASQDMAPSTAIAPGESIWVSVANPIDGSGIADVRFYGAIVAGPHAGKAPPPYTLTGGSSFFEVIADSCRKGSGAVVQGNFFVNLDDEYFRGGDVLRYFWWAQDGNNRVSSDPPGITDVSNLDLATAEQLAGGLREVSYLPTIAWDQSFLSRVQADPYGDVEPTQYEIANSAPQNCMLYVNKVNLNRLSTERTSFMYTLDNVGYRGAYDVYDLQGFGNTNNDLATRCGLDEASVYSLIVHDAGRMRDGAIPDGSDPMVAITNQAEWYGSWLIQGMMDPFSAHTFWVIGENVLTYTHADAFVQALGVNPFALVEDAAMEGDDTPDVRSNSTAEFWGQAPFPLKPFILMGNCPERSDYDSGALDWAGKATHLFSGTTNPALITHKNAYVDSAGVQHPFQTIMMPFSWMDVVDMPDTVYYQGTDARTDLAHRILTHALPINCLRTYSGPVDVIPTDITRRRSMLYQNAPNPFNPTTAIQFELAEEGAATLQIYDLAGRLVRNLVTEKRPPGRQSVTWDGKDGRGNRVASGIYLYRLRAGAFSATRKLVVLK